MRSLIFTALSIALLAPAPGGANVGSTLEQIAQTGRIRIGFRQSVPPMSFRDGEGNPVGYSIDLCNLIVEAVKEELDDPDIAVDFLPVNSQNRFSALSDNKIDLLCGATTKTLSRAEQVDFTQLTFATGASLMSLQSAPVNTVEDLQGQKVGVVKGTTTEKVLEEALGRTGTDAEIVVVDSAVEGFDLLKDGEVAAFSADQVVLIGILFTADFPRRYGVSEVTFSYEPFALALRRNDADFRLIADRVLSRLYRSGRIIEIYGRWFGRFSDEIPSAIAAVYQINATPE
jgi:ABC-type amino acid transport substrate-binding protein